MVSSNKPVESVTVPDHMLDAIADRIRAKGYEAPLPDAALCAIAGFVVGNIKGVRRVIIERAADFIRRKPGQWVTEDKWNVAVWLEDTKDFIDGEGPTLDDAAKACVLNARKVTGVAMKPVDLTADAAAAATAPLDFRPDGSPADVLPLVSKGPSGIGGYAQTEVQP